MTTRARDFKFAGTPVQRLQLAMVALTQKSFSAQYAWFSRGGSHISMLHHTSCIPIIPNDSKIHNIICFIILTLHDWSKPKRAPYKSTLRENHCTYVCMCIYVAICRPCVLTNSYRMHIVITIGMVKVVNVNSSRVCNSNSSSFQGASESSLKIRLGE